MDGSLKKKVNGWTTGCSPLVYPRRRTANDRGTELLFFDADPGFIRRLYSQITYLAQQSPSSEL